MDFLSKIFKILIIPDAWRGEISNQSRSVKKSNIWMTLWRQLVRISLVKLLKCLRLYIFEGLKFINKLFYLSINILHLVDFFCWDQTFDF